MRKESFFYNPMYAMTLSRDTTMQLRCSTMKGFAGESFFDLFLQNPWCTTNYLGFVHEVNVMLIRVQKAESNDFRQATKKHGKIALDSGNYRHGFAVTNRATIAAGTYTAVVSTFNPGQVGPFSIRIASSMALQVRELL